jgi:dihydrofolate reductase
MSETPKYPHLNIIVAIARNGIIGCTNEDGRGALPWHLPEDLKHFKETTSGHPIIMGRKTWESLGRALPNRRNIVITRQADYRAAGAEVFGSLDEALSAVGKETKAFVIGGAELYRQALPLAGQLIITEVDIHAEGDTYFPALEPVWQETSRAAHVSRSGIPYALVHRTACPQA